VGGLGGYLIRIAQLHINHRVDASTSRYLKLTYIVC